MLSLSLGPLALSTSHLVLLLALAAAMLAARRYASLGKRRHPDTCLFWLGLLALAAARLGFVAQYWAQYRPTPWQIIDPRDGGFFPWLGIAVATLVAVLYGWRAPAQRRALAWGLGVGVGLWLAGSALLQWQQGTSHVPELALTDARGAPATLAHYRGQPLVVNLWATWCPPCRREMPALVAAQKSRPGTRFVYVNQGETPANTQTFLGTAGVSEADVLYDSNWSLAKAVGAAAVPTTLFYGPDGRLLGSHLGELSPGSLEHALEVFVQ